MATHRPKDPDTPEFVTGGGGIEIPPSERSLSWDNEDFNSYTDEELARLASAGGEEGQVALFTLWSRYHDFVLKYIRDQLKIDDYQEVTSNFLTKISRAIGRYKPRGRDSFRKWLTKVLKNFVHDYWRARKRRLSRFVSLDDEKQAPFLKKHLVIDESTFLSRVFGKENLDRSKKILSEEIEKLPNLWRDLLYGYYYKGLSIKKLAEKHHLSESNVKVTLFRARRYLKPICQRYRDDNLL